MASDLNLQARISVKDEASAKLGTFGQGISNIADKLNNALKYGALAATGAIVALGVKSVKAYQEQEVATARLTRGIQNVKSATDKHIDSLLSQASALQKVTRFSDEQIISAQGIFTTFQLNQKAIEALTPRILDMSEGIARVNGGLPDLEGMSMLVAKAIGGEDVTGLVGALRRVGVIMTDTQMQIMTTGTMEERLATITQILDMNFQGLAVSAGETSAGKMVILQNALNDLMEKAGQTIVTALIPMIEKLTLIAQKQDTVDLINRLAQSLVNLIDKLLQAGIWASQHTTLLKALGVVAGICAIAILAVSAAVGGLYAILALTVAWVASLINVCRNWVALFNSHIAPAFRSWSGYVEQLRYGLSALGNAFRSVGDTASGFWGNIKSKLGFQRGGFIPQEGMYYLHKGEQVVPSSQVSGGGGKTFNININGNMSDSGSLQEMARYIAREIEVRGLNG